jgi:hypothetical protein
LLQVFQFDHYFFYFVVISYISVFFNQLTDKVLFLNNLELW